MAITKATPLDIDALERKTFDGRDLEYRMAPVCYQISSEQAHGRKQPAGVVGKGAEHRKSVIAKLSNRPPAVPWSGFVTLSRAKIIGRGLCLTGNNKILLGGSLLLNPRVFPQKPMRRLVSRNETDAGAFLVTIPDNSVSPPGLVCHIGSLGMKVYGHWIVDVLPRLYRILSSGLAVDHYAVGMLAQPWQIDMLEALGLDLAKVFFWDSREYALDAGRLMIPTFFRISSELREDFRDVHAFLLEKHAASESRNPAVEKLFVSRADLVESGRQLVNRQELEAIFAAEGFEIIRPAQLPFVEQIRLFARAAIVVGECGSGLHNTVFCRSGTRVGVIQSSVNYNMLQGQIAMWAGHDLYYLIGMPTTADGTIESDWSIDIADARGFIEMLTEPTFRFGSGPARAE